MQRSTSSWQKKRNIYMSKIRIKKQGADCRKFAYKSLEDMIDVIKDSVDIIDVMKPIYNFNASE